ncbi:hypothetical protein FOE78_22125 [Microlunatus elymi]|uniref:DUF1269 domain-containing protein n=1 Tax=Microlunatus elymi TaxID=2596828 RepID=A0A516Q4U5_9ACTN|nr:hypothetical protein [Microlunatus elymi]QDP98241.1 hypothetical protein FOE78_22125 [Microlunatus elymi]
MTGAADQRLGIDPDLVEYIVVTTPDADRLTEVARALVAAVEHGAIQILDVVVILSEPGAALRRVVEIEDADLLPELVTMKRPFGTLLSDHDIELIGVSLEPDDTALLILVETRWAEPLSLAARRVGGRVAGGERVSHRRVAGALARMARDDALDS